MYYCVGSLACIELLLRLIIRWYSKEQMEQKLLYAINSGAGFDLSWKKATDYRPAKDCFLCVLKEHIETPLIYQASIWKRVTSTVFWEAKPHNSTTHFLPVLSVESLKTEHHDSRERRCRYYHIYFRKSSCT